MLYLQQSIVKDLGPPQFPIFFPHLHCSTLSSSAHCNSREARSKGSKGLALPKITMKSRGIILGIISACPRSFGQRYLFGELCLLLSPKKRVFLWECCPLSFIAIPCGKHGDFGGFCCLCRLQSLQGGAPVDQIDKLTHILISGWCLVAHPTARKWVSSPQFFECINPTYPIYNCIMIWITHRELLGIMITYQLGVIITGDYDNP